MSVQGEFERLLGRCTDVLAEADAPAAEAWVQALAAARAVASRDLTEGARRVLCLPDAAPAAADVAFATSAQRADFLERWEHLMAIARVIAGDGAQR